MVMAELGGKISRSGANISDRSEDLLTSDVFGALRYLPPDEGLIRILCAAKRFSDGKCFEFGEGEGLRETLFWNRLKESEPDVILVFEKSVVFIEVKYLSGKSGHFSEELDAITNLEAASSDQLYREFVDLHNYKGEFERRFLIYLSAHRRMPVEDIRAGSRAISVLDAKLAPRYEMHTFWLSWYAVYTTLLQLMADQKDPHRLLVLSDIKNLLFKKGFRYFQGYRSEYFPYIIDPVPRKEVYFHRREPSYFYFHIPYIDSPPTRAFYERYHAPYWLSPERYKELGKPPSTVFYGGG